MRTFLLAAVAATAAAPAASAQDVFQTEAGPIAVEAVAGPFEDPWAVAFLSETQALVTERPGRLVLVDLETNARTTVNGVPEVYARRQGGLLDVALARDFAETGEIYLSYSDPEPDGARTAVARATLVLGEGPYLNDLAPIFEMTPTVSGGRHFGSRIVVAPDETLFITTGDRGEPARAQDRDGHIGKVIRVARDGAVPADNPFVGQDGALPEIYSLGHRNPQGATLGPDGRLWTVEHGARGGDEINRPEPGLNYGWPEISYGRHYSGFRIGQGTSAPGFEQPAFYWDPSIAPSGFAYYDGAAIPGFQGNFFVGALAGADLHRLTVEDGAVVADEPLFDGAFGRVRDVRQGPDGALWFLVDDDEGMLYRITAAEPS